MFVTKLELEKFHRHRFQILINFFRRGNSEITARGKFIFAKQLVYCFLFGLELARPILRRCVEKVFDQKVSFKISLVGTTVFENGRELIKQFIEFNPNLGLVGMILPRLIMKPSRSRRMSGSAIKHLVSAVEWSLDRGHPLRLVRQCDEQASKVSQSFSFLEPIGHY